MAGEEKPGPSPMETSNPPVVAPAPPAAADPIATGSAKRAPDASTQEERAAVQVDLWRRQIQEARSRHWFNRLASVGLVITGLWALFTFVVTSCEKLEHSKRVDAKERKEAALARYLTVSLSGRVVTLAPTYHWVHARLKLINPSRRPIRPLFITWWFQASGGKTELINEFGGLTEGQLGFQNIYPGQTIEVPQSYYLSGADPAVRVRAEIFYAQIREDEECILNPNQFAGGAASSDALKNMKTQPITCVRDPKSPLKCAEHSAEHCVVANVERLVQVKPIEGVHYETEHTF